jgi:hypothetical protein
MAVVLLRPPLGLNFPVGVYSGQTFIGAICAKAAVGDIYLIDQKVFGEVRVQTGCCTDCTIDVNYGVAGPTDEVVMIVSRACFVKHGPAINTETSQEAGFGEMRKTIVDCLMRHFGQNDSDVCQDGGCADMRPHLHRFQNGNALSRYPEPGIAYGIFGFHILK